MPEEFDGKLNLISSFVHRCKEGGSRFKVADSSGAALNARDLLLRSLVLRRLLRRHVLAEDEKFVGVLLPPAVAACVTNMALTLDHRVAVNLNYTVSSDVMNACIKQSDIRHVLTSHRFMEKMDFDLDAELIHLEDFKEKPTLADKAIAAAQAHVIPATMLVKHFGLDKIDDEDVLTVIFTSGSTGTPKGVMLTNANVHSNVAAINHVMRLTPDDVLIGILPFFHSFGYTIALWTAMSLDVKGVYHYSPLDAKQIGKLCEKHKGTVLLSTPTFLRSYLRRVTPEQFATLDLVVAGAEKLTPDLCDAFEKKFGVRPVEGYGATELSPLVSVNVPANRTVNADAKQRKEGTVGRPIPEVEAKVIDPESGHDLGLNQAGMLLVRGPNVMKGYLGRDDLTEKTVKDGWYVTGDIAEIDADGFIRITGRESRFSKIGGEMVPHILIEETLAKLIGGDEEDGLRAAVTAVPDAKKGERLVVIHTRLDQAPGELCKKLSEAGLPNLYIPAEDSFCEVTELPILGSGKLDLKGIKQLALERFAC